jgi:hypothetical protein
VSYLDFMHWLELNIYLVVLAFILVELVLELKGKK